MIRTNKVPEIRRFGKIKTQKFDNSGKARSDRRFSSAYNIFVCIRQSDRSKLRQSDVAPARFCTEFSIWPLRVVRTRLTSLCQCEMHARRSRAATEWSITDEHYLPCMHISGAARSQKESPPRPAPLSRSRGAEYTRTRRRGEDVHRTPYILLYSRYLRCMEV